MFRNTAFYADKGGQGTTVTAACHAMAVAAGADGAVSVLLVDHRGDAAAVLGLPEPTEGERVSVSRGLDLIVCGHDDALPFAEVYVFDTDRAAVEDVARRYDAAKVVVVRNDYLSLRRLMGSPATPDAAVVLIESGRSLRASDVDAVVPCSVAASINIEPSVARAVDAGLLATRLPQCFAVSV